MSVMPGRDVYADAIRANLGRALSRLDIEPTSRSCGSFDRTWWCWKFTDMSASRFQEGAFLLAWLYTSSDAPRGYAGNEKVLRAAEAAVRFWRTLQHGDGSFDEAYPWERSLAATAFTGFYIGCATERLADHWSADASVAAQSGLRGLADWLDHNSESHAVISNHLAAAAAALHVAGDVLGTDRYRAGRDRFIDIILNAADMQEGWFREYSGADPGYQSHAMFYLAEIWRRTGNASLADALRSACRFMAWFAHPDGTLGGEYASRGTKFVYPAAFEMLAQKDAAAAALAAHTRCTIAAGRSIGPSVVDAWNLFPLLNNYVFALDAARDVGTAAPLPWQLSASESAVFPRCGLAVVRRGSRVAALGLRAGGSIKVWEVPSGALIYEDCGYADRSGTRTALSQAPSKWTSSDRDGTLIFEVTVRFRRLPQALFGAWKFLTFRVFSTTVGRVPGVALWLKNLLVRTLIAKRDKTAAVLVRRIAVSSDGAISIDDRVTGARELMALSRQVPLHMGSSRYAHADDWLGARIGVASPSPATNGISIRSVRVDASVSRCDG
jgi:hypothetical protein